MGYFTQITALGIVLLFGFWSGRRRFKSQRGQDLRRQAAKLHPLSGVKKQTNLRRIK